MRVYHGSNKIFDHFDLSFQGEGEGASLLVPGAYFATTVSMAEEYRKRVATPGADHTDSCYFNESGSRVPADPVYIKQLLDVCDDTSAPETMREKAHDELEALGARNPVLMEGAVHEVVVPDREFLLQWEGSIEDQPFDVVELLRTWYGEDEVEEIYEEAMEEYSGYDTDYFDRIFEAALLRGVGDMRMELKEIASDFDWERLDKLMGAKCPNLQPDEGEVGRALYFTIQHVEGGDEAAAKFLSSYGVSGVVSSREFIGMKGENEVVVIWNQKDIDMKGMLSPDQIEMEIMQEKGREPSRESPGSSYDF